MSIKYKTRWVVFTGVCAGLAEIIWVFTYSLYSRIDPSVIAGSITQTFISNEALIEYAPAFGIIVHLGLSIVLALGFALVVLPYIQGFSSKYSALIVSLLTLAVVWKINFFILLPLINPDFISLLPLHISLISKLLFGMTMGWMLMGKVPDSKSH